MLFYDKAMKTLVSFRRDRVYCNRKRGQSQAKTLTTPYNCQNLLIWLKITENTLLGRLFWVVAPKFSACQMGLVRLNNTPKSAIKAATTNKQGTIILLPFLRELYLFIQYSLFIHNCRITAFSLK